MDEAVKKTKELEEYKSAICYLVDNFIKETHDLKLVFKKPETIIIFREKLVEELTELFNHKTDSNEFPSKSQISLIVIDIIVECVGIEKNGCKNKSK